MIAGTERSLAWWRTAQNTSNLGLGVQGLIGPLKQRKLTGTELRALT